MYVYIINIHIHVYTYNVHIDMYIYSEFPTEKYCFTHDGNKTIGKKRQVCSRPKGENRVLLKRLLA